MRNNNERLVDRYIAGRMGPEEERRFLEQAEANPALGRLLKAEQVIGNALAKDRAAVPLAPTEPSAWIMAKLEATNPAALAAGAAGTPAGSGLIGTLLFGTKLAQVIVTIVGATAIAVGTFFIVPLLDHSPDVNQTIPAVVRGLKPSPAATAPRLDPTTAPAATSGGEHVRAAAKPVPASATARRSDPAAPGAQRRNDAPANPAPNAAASLKADHHAGDPAPLEVENTKVKVDIKMNQKKAE